MSSFKLQKGVSAKEQARGAGLFLALLGVVVALLMWALPGWIMFVTGLVFFVASFAASE